MVVLAGVQRLLSDPVTLMLCVIPLIIHNLMVCLRTVYPGLCKPTPRPGRATLHAGKRDRAADTAAQRSLSGEARARTRRWGLAKDGDSTRMMRVQHIVNEGFAGRTRQSAGVCDGGRSWQERISALFGLIWNKKVGQLIPKWMSRQCLGLRM